MLYFFIEISVNTCTYLLLLLWFPVEFLLVFFFFFPLIWVVIVIPCCTISVFSPCGGVTGSPCTYLLTITSIYFTSTESGIVSITYFCNSCCHLICIFNDFIHLKNKFFGNRYF